MTNDQKSVELNKKRSKQEIDEEYTRCAALVGDRDYKLDKLNQEIGRVQQEKHDLKAHMDKLNAEIQNNLAENNAKAEEIVSSESEGVQVS